MKAGSHQSGKVPLGADLLVRSAGKCVNANFPCLSKCVRWFFFFVVFFPHWECVWAFEWGLLVSSALRAVDDSKLPKIPFHPFHHPFILFLNSGSSTHTFTCRSVWSIYLFIYFDNLRLSTWQTDGSSNLPDRHCFLISDLMITVCVHVRFPRMNPVNLSSEIPCWFVWVCSSSVFCVTTFFFFWQL